MALPAPPPERERPTALPRQPSGLRSDASPAADRGRSPFTSWDPDCDATPGTRGSLLCSSLPLGQLVVTSSPLVSLGSISRTTRMSS